MRINFAKKWEVHVALSRNQTKLSKNKIIKLGKFKAKQIINNRIKKKVSLPMVRMHFTIGLVKDIRNSLKKSKKENRRN